MRGKILIILFLVTGFIWWRAVLASPAELKVAFLDIGQGDAIYIEAPNGNQVLIDGGPGRGVLRALGEVMPWSDKTLDLVIATHPDADHIGGLPAVLERYEVAGVMDNGQPSNTQIYRTWQAAAAAEVEAGAKKILAQRGERVILGDGIYLDILYPFGVPTGKDTNDGSVVAKLTYGASSYLLIGDATIKVEQQLLNQDPNILKTEVLKAGHHGSKTSSGPEFVAAVKPEYAIISVGKDNRYGHPHQVTLDTLVTAGAKILRTDESGTITCVSDSVVTTCRPKAL
ncbi:MAG: ComEC/Rec2 family competence protein [bacterium]|nr:ComEC/Rec2 family competence protein [bacterium]